MLMEAWVHHSHSVLKIAEIGGHTMQIGKLMIAFLLCVRLNTNTQATLTDLLIVIWL
jgi:hypothetical protein